MIPTKEPAEKGNIPFAAIGVQALTVGGEVGCLTIIILLGAIFGGLWLDRLFGTKPLITLFFVVASAPLSLFLTFWVAKRAVKPISRSTLAGGESIPTEGETAGE